MVGRVLRLGLVFCLALQHYSDMENETAKENAEAAIRVLNVRLEAIEKGAFTIDAFGNIQLDDAQLAPLRIGL